MDDDQKRVVVDIFLGLQNSAAEYGYEGIDCSPDDWTAYFQQPDAKSYAGTKVNRLGPHGKHNTIFQ